MNEYATNLARLQAAKHVDTTVGSALGPEMIGFFKQSVAKRQTKLVQIAECWSRSGARDIERALLTGVVDAAGSLTVLVDSASHLYELKQLMLAGLEQQLQIACKKSGLRKVMLRPGRWYAGESGDRSPRFQ